MEQMLMLMLLPYANYRNVEWNNIVATELQRQLYGVL